MGGGSKQTVGYKYYLGMHMILCHGPVDYVTEIKADDRLAWSGRARIGARINVTSEGLFGGEDREGGISGAIDIEMGEDAQLQNDYLQSQLGPDIPAYRGVVGAVLRQVYLGLNPYIKPWSFRAQRVFSRQSGLLQWYSEKAPIGGLHNKDGAAIYFALDNSSSMSAEVSPGITRLDALRDSVKEALDEMLVLLEEGTVSSFDVQITEWGNDPDEYTTQLERTIDNAKVASLKGFMDSWAANRATDFPSGLLAAPTFFDNSPSDLQHLLFFITDGWPNAGPNNPTQTQAENAQEAKDIIDTLDSTVEVYGMNVGLADTTYTEYVDTTPLDGVPVISLDNIDEVKNRILGSLRGGFDLNPAHIIRECLTDPDWGMGYPEADLNDTFFRNAADQLYLEEMGISLLWDRQMPIEDFILEIARHINATLYVDRITGQFHLKLIRDDYDVGALLELNPSNIANTKDYTRQDPGEAVNSVTVVHWDSATGKDSTVTADDIALIQAYGTVINTTIQYTGFTNSTIAAKAAARDLKILSSPLLTCNIEANREASSLNIGDVFKLVWPDYHDGYVVMRVQQIALGGPNNNRVKIQATEDVFALPSSVIIGTEEPSWENLAVPMTPCPIKIVMEAPYYNIVNDQGQTTTDGLINDNNGIGFFFVAAGKPVGAIKAQVWVDNGAGYENSASLDFAPYGQIESELTKDSTTIAIINSVGLDRVGADSLAQIGTEIIKIDTVDTVTGIITFGRGVLDTVPVLHTEDSYVLFWQDFDDSDDTEYVHSEDINIKILPSGSIDTLDLTAAQANNVIFNSRAIRPYPPGNLKVNGVIFPIDFDGTLALTWAHRDRLQQTGGLPIVFRDGNIGPEIGATYTLRLYNEADVLSKTVIDITDNFYSWSDEIADSNLGRFNERVRFELETIRDGYVSFSSYDVTVLRAGYGVSYGNYYGSVAGSLSVLNSFNANLLAFYTMDNISGATLVDESVNGSDGTIDGATIGVGTGLGNSNTLSFDGTNDHVLTPLLLNIQDWTISCWLTDNSLVDTSFVSNHNNQGDGRFSLIALATSRFVRVFLGSTTHGDLALTSTTALSTTELTHVIITKSGTTYSIYMDNGFEASGSNSEPIDSLACRIGSMLTGAQRWLGDVEHFRMFNRVMGSDERDLLYQEGNIIKPTHVDLLAFYTMDNITGATVFDESTNSVDGTLVGNAAAVVGGGVDGNDSVGFDGDGDRITLTGLADTLETKSEFTLVFWYKRDPADPLLGAEAIIGCATASGSRAGFTIHYAGSSNLHLRSKTSGNVANTFLSTGSSVNINDNAWHLCILELSIGDSIANNLYVDNELLASGVNDLVYTIDIPDVYVGETHDTFYPDSEGEVDHLRFFDGHLTANKREALYTEFNHFN